MSFQQKYLLLLEAQEIVTRRITNPEGRTSRALIAALEEGAMVAEVRTGGKWNSVDAPWWQDPEINKIKWPSRYTNYVVSSDEVDVTNIRVQSSDVNRLWPPVEAASTQDASSLEDQSRKRPAGRPAKYDWEGGIIELARLVHTDGLPEAQAELERHLAEWFVKETGNQPDIKEIKERVRRFYRVIKSA